MGRVVRGARGKSCPRRDSAPAENTNTGPRLSEAEIRELFVPANQPELWPEGDWQVVDRKEYRRLVEGLTPPPPAPSEAVLRRIRYQAVFTGEKLQGRFLARIQRVGGRRLLFPWDHSNLALSSLTWADQDGAPENATWGSTSAGETLLVLPGSAGAKTLELHGEWSAPARRFAERTEFDLSLVPATVSELELLLPLDWELAASAGHVKGPSPIRAEDRFSGLPISEVSAFGLWRISLGSEHASKLSLSRKKPGGPAKPLVLAEADTSYVVRDRELQVEARYDLKVAFAPITEISFQVPRTIRVYAVTYGGDASLGWQVKSGGNQQQRLVIQLPDPLVGESRPIRIQGLARVQSGRAWKLPQVTCRQASLLRGEVYLTIEAPLELRTYDAQGYRQTAISVKPDQRETLTFSQIAAEAEFTAYIGTPRFSMSAQVVNQLATETEEWQMRSEIAWTCQAGSRFVASCEVLPGWEILDVRRVSESSLPVISDWRLSESVGTPRLTIEFLEALTPMQGKRVQILARRLPMSPGQSLSLSSVRPLSCRSVEQFLAAFLPKGSSLAIEDASGIVQKTVGNLPEFARSSSLAPQAKPANGQAPAEFFYAAPSDSSASGQLTLHSIEPPFDASVLVQAMVTEQTLAETLEFSIQPLDSPVDQITLRGFAAGDGWNWQIEPAGQAAAAISPPESAGREPPEKRPWILHLPMPQVKPFRLTARRELPIKPQQNLALPQLPTAQEFQGAIELGALPGVGLDVTESQLQETPMEERETARPRLFKRWKYRLPEAVLAVAISRDSAPAEPVLARLSLASRIEEFGRANGHRARFALEPRSQHFPFAFRLPQEAELIEVRVNGEPVIPRQGGDQRSIPYLPPDQTNVVEVDYEVPSEPAAMRWTCGVPIPQADTRLLEFRWLIGLSPNLRLADVPEGTSLVTPMPASHWTTRLFGPLGRGTSVPFLPWNGDSWQRLFVSEPAAGPAAETSASDDFFPAGWTIYEAQGPRAGDRLTLPLWEQSAADRWGWIVLLGSLMAGFALRIANYRHRRQVGLVWFLASLLAAGLLPMPWAMLAGGCFSGTCLAFLFPRRFLKRSPEPPAEAISQDSTATFHHQHGMSVFVLGLLGFSWWLWAGASPARQIYGQETSPSLADRPLPAQEPPLKFHVMIPVQDPQGPKPGPLVYVDRQFLDRLKQAQPKPPKPATYLISSADYQAAVDSQGAVEIAATFQVVVLTPNETVQVPLPIGNAYPGGPNHCLVDGAPHSVLSDPAGKGYVVELAARPLEPASPGPAVAEKAGSNGPGKTSFETHEIKLRLHGRSESVPNGGRYSLTVPPIAASRLSVNLPKAYPALGIRGLHGQVLSTTTGKTAATDVGAAQKLEIFWNQQPGETPAVVNAEAKVFALATLHPLWNEWQIRAAYRPKAEVSSLVWSLPANANVKSVKAEKLLSYRLIGDKTQSRLLLEFQEPPASEFTVDVHCVTPRPASRSSNPQVSLPALDLFAAPSGQTKPDVVEAEYQFGVVTTPELAMAPVGSTLKMSENLAPVAPERFLAAYRTTAAETLGIRTPQLAWKLQKPVELEFSLKPRTPVRRARLNQEGRIGEHEIQWRLTAEVETTNAPAFRHVLQVPADLVIESLSVQEDETERLVRWSKTGTRLELVLSEGTSGIQNVNLTGHLPLALEEGRRAPLPLIRVDEAEQVDSGLRVYQLQSVGRNLRIEKLDDLPPWESVESQPATGEAFLLAAVRLRHDSPAPVLVVEAPLEPAAVDRAVIVGADLESRSEIATLIRVRENAQTRRGLAIQIPPAMTQEFRVEFADQPRTIVPYQTTIGPDQSLRLHFEPAVLANRRVLGIIASVDVSSAGAWTPPQIQIPGGRIEDSFLIVSPDFAARAEDDAGTPSLVSELPGWIQASWNAPAEDAGFQVYKHPKSHLEFVPARLAPGTNPAHEGRLHTTLWLTDPQRIAGRTVIELSKENLHDLVWHWPKSTELEACLIDGIPQTATPDEEHETLELSAPAFEDAGTLELYWSQKLEAGLPRFGRLDLSLPKPLDVPLEEARVTLLPPVHTRLIPQRAFQTTPNTGESSANFAARFKANCRARGQTGRSPSGSSIPVPSACCSSRSWCSSSGASCTGDSG